MSLYKIRSGLVTWDSISDSITAVMCGQDHKHNLTVPSIDLACRESHIVIQNLIKTLDAKTVNYNGFQNLERTYRLPHNYVILSPRFLYREVSDTEQYIVLMNFLKYQSCVITLYLHSIVEYWTTGMIVACVYNQKLEYFDKWSFSSLTHHRCCPLL